jgi:hypothetical protein
MNEAKNQDLRVLYAEYNGRVRALASRQNTLSPNHPIAAINQLARANNDLQGLVGELIALVVVLEARVNNLEKHVSTE